MIIKEIILALQYIPDIILHKPDTILDIQGNVGKTFRELNNEMKHNIPIGILVEIIPWDGDCFYGGMRMFVNSHDRDCDGTPLYTLGSKNNQDGCERGFGGFLEDSLKRIN